MPPFHLAALVGSSLDFLLTNPLAFVILVTFAVAMAGLWVIRVVDRRTAQVYAEQRRQITKARFDEDRRAYRRPTWNKDDGPKAA